MKRPAAVIGFTSVITLILCNILGSSSFLLAAVAAFLVAAVFFIINILTKKNLWLFTTIFLTVTAAVLLFWGHTAYYTEHNKLLYGEEISINATLIDLPSKLNDEYYSYKLKVNDSGKKIHGNILLISDEKLEITHYDKINCSFKVNDFIDNEIYASGAISRAKNIYLSGFIDNKTVIITPGTSKFNIFYHLLNLRSKVFSNVDTYTGSETSGLIKGILTSDKDDLSEDINDAFRITGLSHTLSVSGLHLSLLVANILLLCTLFNLNKKLKLIIAMLVAVIFAGMVGFTPAVTRSLIMTLITFCGVLIRKESDSLNSLGVAAIVLCIMNPFTASGISFQLSFLATLGIVTLGSEFSALTWKFNIKNKIIKKTCVYFSSTALTTISATVFTIPLTSYLFGYISLSVIAANMLAIIPVTVILFTSPLISVFSFNPVLAGVFGLISSKTAGFLIAAVTKLSYLQGMVIYSRRWYVYAIFTILIIFLLVKKYSKIKIEYSSLAAIGACFIIVIFALCTPAKIIENTNFYVKMIDVEHGDSIIIADSGEAVLVDTGTASAANKIIDELNSDGFKALNAILVSHEHNDHIGGLKRVVSVVPPQKVVFYDNKTTNKTGEALKAYILAYNIELVKIKEDTRLEYLQNTELEYLVSHIEDDGKVSDLNKLSAIITAQHGDKRFLFMGDYDFSQKKLMKVYENKLKCDVLKVAHHGSKKSVTDEFLDFIGNKYALISVSSTGRYGLPAADTIKSLRKKSVITYLTSEHGTVKAYIENNELKFEGKAS